MKKSVQSNEKFLSRGGNWGRWRYISVQHCKREVVNVW